MTCPWCAMPDGEHEATCRCGMHFPRAVPVSPVMPRRGTMYARIVAYVAAEPYTTSADLVADLGMDIYAASTRLRQLAERGILDRRKVSKPHPGRHGRRSGRSTVYVYTVAT